MTLRRQTTVLAVAGVVLVLLLLATLPDAVSGVTVAIGALLTASLIGVLFVSNRPEVVEVPNEESNRNPLAELRVARAMGVGIGFVIDDGDLNTPSPTLVAMAGPWDGPAGWWAAVREEVRMPTPRTCRVCGGEERVGLLRLDMDTPRGVRRVYQLNIHGHAHEFTDVRGSLLLVRDMTVSSFSEENLRRLNEEMMQARDHALAASRSKSAFLANMSHELRTPLNAIIGYSEMLLEDQEEGDEEMRLDLERIRGQGAHLLHLISDILDLSKVEAGKLDLHPESFAISDLAREALATATPLARKNRNKLTLACADDVGAMTADPTRVRQVLFNLLSNACKFTERGEVELRVDRQPVGPLMWVRFQVRDSGMGMSAVDQRKLFEPFWQADASTTRRHGGTGLGLAISRRFVQQMGGRIDIQSEPGQGSIFTVLLPAETGTGVGRTTSAV
ncbi:MAG: hypothetical protein GY913_18415 [Proteobacteria bacterium]|nr:hypothetical protein [Pseudomonadota bacterium]